MYKYWGKAEESSWHPLPYHCMDVAAVADQWWKNSSSIRHSFSHETGLSEEEAHAWMMFFIALHDLGKFDVRFQMKVLDLAKDSYNSNLSKNVRTKDYFHGDEGYKWFVLESADLYFKDVDYKKQRWLQNWFASVAGHHGSIPTNAEPNLPPFVDESITSKDCLARQNWIHGLNHIFLEPAGITFDDIPTKNPPVLLAGFCSVCDWLGSNREYFEFQQNASSLEEYFSSRKEKALKALSDFGLLAHIYTIGGMKALYPNYTPQNIQTLIDRLPVEQSLIIIEADTGSGKTEAALAYASKLLADSLADSIVFALPTQATANAMLERLENVSDKIFGSNDNIILAHGKRDSNAHFRKMIERHKQSVSPQGDLEAGAQCSEWLSSSRKRAFLGQIAVTTVDQVMLSAIRPLKHFFVRSFGIGKGVLIIDEVHAYDAYMYGILEAVIKQQKQAGGSVILLSATLPAYQKQSLCSAWGTNAAIDEKEYPLILQATDNDVHSFALETRDCVQDKIVEIELWKTDDCSIAKDQLERIVKAAEEGAKIGIVCNLVDDAQRYAHLLGEITYVPVDIFHSRYRYCDRMNKEKAVLDNYDKNSSDQGRILVGTQVIEQSLDIDFDWMISFICPIDLLFQRMGRLHRHLKQRPESYNKPLCTVVMPNIGDVDLMEDPKKIYGLHNYVYKNTRVLWRTQCLLEQNDKIHFPEAYRDWIEQVYDKERWDNEPESLTKAHEEYETEEWASKWISKGLTQADTFFMDSEGNANSLTREGKMNLSVIPVMDESGVKHFLDGLPVPKPDDKFDRELLSQNSLGVPDSNFWRSVLPQSQDGLHYLPMMKTDNGWRFDYDGGYLIYTQDRGLQKVKHDEF
ncbi:CRISPR-associated helicase/endonuclease Cas3 [uncultured Methanolobus sp.]|uniref:CRISPR-associated helicase/endonuclease Cas3 n=1 Tax=uncultured Methanolobus sp. TaxID=218300 RepID=UPI002AAACE03|nr:CRISPR-associated helicase/endonuclease Cas3 [uncultured Methanolobus sp.]